VQNVISVSVTAQLFEFTKESTWRRRFLIAMGMIRDLIRIHIFTIITEERPYKSYNFKLSKCCWERNPASNTNYSKQQLRFPLTPLRIISFKRRA
jgi:hypothetical protein